MKRYIILVSSIISIGLTIIFSLIPLNGLSQANVSSFFPTFITPIGLTFSVWGLIYLSWIILGIYLIIKNQKEITKKEYLYFTSAQILSALWLIPWHYLIICMTFSIIFLILGLLYYLIIYPPKNIIFRKVTELYFGWILVATILNLHVFLVFSENYKYGLTLSVISIIVGVIINFFLLKKYKTYISSTIMIWALIGIILNQGNNYVQITSIIGIFILILKIIYNITKYNKISKQKILEK